MPNLGLDLYDGFGMRVDNGSGAQETDLSPP
jgi:hypothetical protein